MRHWHGPFDKRGYHHGNLKEARLVDALVAHMAVEIAVRALRQAERPVHIDAKAGVAGRVVEHAPDVSRASVFGKRLGRPGGEIDGGLDGPPAARRPPRHGLRRLGAMAPEDEAVMPAAPALAPPGVAA